MWDGEQVISAEWVARSTAPTVSDIRPASDEQNDGYGYQWWVPRFEDDPTTVYAGLGYGGQFLMVVPDLDIVLVFNSWNIHESPERSTFLALWERILPAVR